MKTLERKEQKIKYTLKIKYTSNICISTKVKTFFWKILVRQCLTDIGILLWKKKKALLLKIAEDLLPKKGDIHLWKIPPCTEL